MSRRQAFLLCAFPALSTILLASDGRTPIAAAVSNATDIANERGMPALFSWGDLNGDGRLDLAAVSGDGKLQLLVNSGDGRFEDVTERVGLFNVGNAALAVWADYDGDGRLDLFVGARAGASRLFHNEPGEVFIDVSTGSGLSSNGAVQSAQWFDYDGDGRLDLFIVTAQKSALYRGLAGGLFELAELPLAVSTRLPSTQVMPVDSRFDSSVEGTTSKLPDPGSERGAPHTRGSEPASSGVGASSSVVVPFATPPGPHASALATCVMSITDQAMPLNCLEASTAPTLGRLYPISANFFVAPHGNVGIGTTSPAAKLDVAGAARMAGTLTLNATVDKALDVSTGSIYKGGVLFIHTKGAAGNTALGQLAMTSVTTGINNTASGFQALSNNTMGSDNTANGGGALRFNTTGSFNTASGYRALSSNTTGLANTASGHRALSSNTTGNNNTASGYLALRSNTTGSGNTASGYRALFSNTIGGYNTASGYLALLSNTTGYFNTASGYRALISNTTGSNNTASGPQSLSSNTTGLNNTASGLFALISNTTGSRNIALGSQAGSYLTTGNDNIAIGNSGVTGEGATIRLGDAGTHRRAFIAGIRGVTTGNANAIPVVVDSSGQLGTVSSSRRFKKDIADMGELTDRLLELRPVVFHYKQEQKLPDGGEVPLEYGLIAEEVAEIFPDLVVNDEQGKPFTVKYHLLSAMLLNETKKQAHELAEQRSELMRLRGLEARLDALESRATGLATVPTANPGGGR